MIWQRSGPYAGFLFHCYSRASYWGVVSRIRGGGGSSGLGLVFAKLDIQLLEQVVGVVVTSQLAGLELLQGLDRGGG